MSPKADKKCNVSVVRNRHLATNTIWKSMLSAKSGRNIGSIITGMWFRVNTVTTEGCCLIHDFAINQWEEQKT